MNYDIIIHYASILMFALAALVFVTNIMVEVFKSVFPKLPTNILAVLIAMGVTLVAAAVLMAYLQIAFVWYYVPVVLILGVFVAYAAMFGFDKFKEAFDKLTALKR